VCESVVGNSVPKCAHLRKPKFDQHSTHKANAVCLKTTKTHQTSLLAGADIPAKFRILTTKSGAKLKHTKKDACYPNRSKTSPEHVVTCAFPARCNLTPKTKVKFQPQNEARSVSTSVKMQHTPKKKSHFATTAETTSKANHQLAKHHTNVTNIRYTVTANNHTPDTQPKRIIQHSNHKLSTLSPARHFFNGVQNALFNILNRRVKSP